MPSKNCVKCGNKVTDKANFCPGCGYHIAVHKYNKQNICGKCGEPLDARAKFCTSCGTRFTEVNIQEYQKPTAYATSTRTGKNIKKSGGFIGKILGVIFKLWGTIWIVCGMLSLIVLWFDTSNMLDLVGTVISTIIVIAIASIGLLPFKFFRSLFHRNKASKRIPANTNQGTAPGILESADKKISGNGRVEKVEVKRFVPESQGIANDKKVKYDIATKVHGPVKTLPYSIEIARENEYPADRLAEMKKYYSIQAAKDDVRILEDCKNIIQSTVNFDTFFSRSELGMRKAANLDMAGAAGVGGVKRSELLKSFSDFVNTQKSRLLTEAYSKTVDKIILLKSQKAKENNWIKFLDSLDKYIDEFEFIDIYDPIRLDAEKQANKR